MLLPRANQSSVPTFQGRPLALKGSSQRLNHWVYWVKMVAQGGFGQVRSTLL